MNTMALLSAGAALAAWIDGHWVHDLRPFLIQFSDTFGIRYYGLAYVFGFGLAVWLLHRYARAGRSQVRGETISDLMIAVVAGVLIGGRLGHFVLYEPGVLRYDPLAFFRLWEGGMASHGGFAGVAVALAWFSRRKRIAFLHVSDVIASATPAGLLLGRIANFINGELWGKVSDVPWAVIFPQSARPGTPLILIEPRHPSQLYQAALEGGLLFAYVQWRFWRSDIVRARPGQLVGEFLIGYAILRAIGEVFREPDAPLLFGISRGTFYSMFLVVGGIALIVAARRRAGNPPAPPARA
jgi:phosphatidylglycerol---prolipoprotein diacylglyceryl transferase